MLFFNFSQKIITGQEVSTWRQKCYWHKNTVAVIYELYGRKLDTWECYAVFVSLSLPSTSEPADFHKIGYEYYH